MLAAAAAVVRRGVTIMRSKLLCVLAATLFFSLLLRTRGWPDVITSRVVRAPRQGLSPSRRENRRCLGARDASQACAGVDAGRSCSIQALEALCRLWTQGSTGIEPGTLSHLRAFAATVANPTAGFNGPYRSRQRWLA